jgi:hypothetical protein
MRRVGPALAVGLAMILAGCASGNEVRSDTSIIMGPTNPRVFSVELNVLCQDAQRVPYGGSEPRIVARYERYLGKLTTLTATGAFQATYNRFTSHLDRAVGLWRAGRTARASIEIRDAQYLARQLNAPACRRLVPRTGGHG